MSLYDIEVTTIDGRAERLDVYRGRALLIVNVASRVRLHASVCRARSPLS